MAGLIDSLTNLYLRVYTGYWLRRVSSKNAMYLNPENFPTTREWAQVLKKQAPSIEAPKPTKTIP